MKPKNPEAVKEAAIAHQNGAVKARQRVQLNPNGALLSVLVRSLSESREVQAATSAFLEARGLEGRWILRITSAELSPVEDSA